MTSSRPSPSIPASVEPALWKLLTYPVGQLNPKEKLEELLGYEETHPGTFTLLGTPGSISLVNIPKDIKMTLWVAMTRQAACLMEGLLVNFTDWKLKNLDNFVMSVTLVNDDCRKAYCSFVTSSLEHEAHGRANQNSLNSEVAPRVVQLMARHVRDGVNNMAMIMEDMTGLMDDDGVQKVLENLLVDLCSHLPGRLDDRWARTERAAELISLLAARGADPHAKVQALDNIIREQSQEVRCVNQLDQMVWLRHINGLGPGGSQGEQDPVVDALLDCGAEWRVVYNAEHTNDAIKQTLSWHSAVKRGLLGDMSQTGVKRSLPAASKL